MGGVHLRVRASAQGRPNQWSSGLAAAARRRVDLPVRSRERNCPHGVQHGHDTVGSQHLGHPDATGRAGCLGPLEQGHDVGRARGSAIRARRKHRVGDEHQRREHVTGGVLKLLVVPALAAHCERESNVGLLQMVPEFVQRGELLPSTTQRLGDRQGRWTGGVHVPACDRAPRPDGGVRHQADLDIRPRVEFVERAGMQPIDNTRHLRVECLQHASSLGNHVGVHDIHSTASGSSCCDSDHRRTRSDHDGSWSPVCRAAIAVTS